MPRWGKPRVTKIKTPNPSPPSVSPPGLLSNVRLLLPPRASLCPPKSGKKNKSCKVLAIPASTIKVSNYYEVLANLAEEPGSSHSIIKAPAVRSKLCQILRGVPKPLAGLHFFQQSVLRESRNQNKSCKVLAECASTCPVSTA